MLTDKDLPDYDEDEEFWASRHDDEEDFENDDPWYPMGCGDPECTMPSGHYRSECMTVADWEAYYEEAEAQTSTTR